MRIAVPLLLLLPAATGGQEVLGQEAGGAAVKRTRPGTDEFLRRLLGCGLRDEAPLDARLDRLGARVKDPIQRARALMHYAKDAAARLAPLAHLAELAPARQRLQDLEALALRISSALPAPEGARSRPDPGTPSSPAAAQELVKLSDALEVAADDYRARFDAGLDLLNRNLARPTLLVASGGSSLGSYQAGFLHYYTQHMIARGRFALANCLAPGASVGQFEIAAGASAGSINAFLATIATCREPVAEPAKSIFWQTWIPVGMTGLLGPGRQRGALFSRAPMDAAIARLQAVMNGADGWNRSQPCQTHFGVSVTPLRARKVRLHPSTAPESAPSLEVHRGTEKFMFTVSGDAGKAPEVSPWVTPMLPEEARQFYPALIAGGSATNGPLPLEIFTEVFKASSSIPIAFQPVRLQYRIDGEPETLAQRFVDGSVFDNNPIRLALRMFHWVDGPSQPGREPTVLVLDSSTIGWDPYQRPARESPDDWPGRSLTGAYAGLLGDFVTAAREAEVMDAIETEPGLAGGLQLPAVEMPLASTYLAAFMGFFEQDFRVFDFYMGMADAWEYLRTSSDTFRVMSVTGALAPVQAPLFDCFTAYREAVDRGHDLDPATLAACRGIAASKDPRERNAFTLLEVSRDMKGWTRSPDHAEANELKELAVLLGRHRFEFHDLRYRGEVATPANFVEAVRDQIQVEAQELGDLEKQLLNRLLVVTAAKAVANDIAYRIPRWFTFVGLDFDRGIEIGTARQVAGSPLRLVATGRVFHFDRTLHEAQYETGIDAAIFEASARAVAEIRWNNFLQPEVGLGYAIRSRDGWGRSLFWRHGPEASAAIVLGQRLYLDFGGTWFLDDCAGNNACGGVSSRYRASQVPLVSNRWELRLSIGWRFLVD